MAHQYAAAHALVKPQMQDVDGKTTQQLFEVVKARYRDKYPNEAPLVFDLNSEEATKKLFDIISLDRNADAIALHRHLNHYISSNKVLTMPYKELVQHKKHCAYAVGIGGAIVTALAAVAMSRLPTILEFSNHNIDLQDLAALQKIATDADTVFGDAFKAFKANGGKDALVEITDKDGIKTTVENPLGKELRDANAESSIADKEVGVMQENIDSHIPPTPDSSEIAFATIICLALAGLTAYGIHHFIASKVTKANDVALMDKGELNEKGLMNLSTRINEDAVKHQDDILKTHKKNGYDGFARA